MNYDIVYILANNLNDSELIYSVRSVIRNFPYNKIWFAGGTPEHIYADIQMPWTQIGDTKWKKINNTIKLICNQEDLTEKFWLFNDDFFVMRPITEVSEVPVIDGTLDYLFRRRIKNDKKILSYATQLLITQKALEQKELDILNYELHAPILMEKEKVLKTLNTFPDATQIRSLYGNQHHIKGKDAHDIKITNEDQKPTGKEIFLSTDEKSFQKGKVGEYIRNRFPDKSKYEL